MSKVMEIFSQRLKELRLSKNLSTRQLGKAINVSKSTIVNWEKMKKVPRGKNLYNLALFFNVTSDYLLGLKDIKTVKSKK